MVSIKLVVRQRGMQPVSKVDLASVARTPLLPDGPKETVHPFQRCAMCCASLMQMRELASRSARKPIIHALDQMIQARPQQQPTQACADGICHHVSVLDRVVVPQRVLHVFEHDAAEDQADADERAFQSAPIELTKPDHRRSECNDVFQLVSVGVKSQNMVAAAGQMNIHDRREPDQADDNPRRAMPGDADGLDRLDDGRTVRRILWLDSTRTGPIVVGRRRGSGRLPKRRRLRPSPCAGLVSRAAPSMS